MILGCWTANGVSIFMYAMGIVLETFFYSPTTSKVVVSSLIDKELAVCERRSCKPLDPAATDAI